MAFVSSIFGSKDKSAALIKKFVSMGVLLVLSEQEIHRVVVISMKVKIIDLIIPFYFLNNTLFPIPDNSRVIPSSSAYSSKKLRLKNNFCCTIALQLSLSVN